jgi:hypothetical protein
MSKVTINNLESFDAAFGQLGLRVGPRTGPDKRTQDDKEWYVVRRFLKHAISEGCFALPISVQKEMPPAPDFVLKRDCAVVGYVEHTEATVEVDQAEFTLSERAAELTSCHGEFGGRYSEGAVGDRPERDWAADVLRAIRRKRSKPIVLWREVERHLVIFPNSNALYLMDEQDAFEVLRESIAKIGPALPRMTSGCAIHVLGKEFVCFDLLGSMRLIKLEL